MNAVVKFDPIGKMSPNRDANLLHYKFRTPLLALLEHLKRSYETGLTKSDFDLFEGYRSPERQNAVFEASASKARGWQSAHQYGLAADIVARVEGQWSWDEGHDWPFLKRSAIRFGLKMPIGWDKCHVESPHWPVVRKLVM